MVTAKRPSPSRVALGRRFRLVQDRLTASLEASLRRFFRDQAARVVRRYLSSRKGAQVEQKDAMELLPKAENRLLGLVILPAVEEQLRQAGDLAAAMSGAESFLDDDPALRAMLNDAAERVTAITEETRQAIRTTLQEAVERHYSPWQTANGVPKDDFPGLRGIVRETYQGRAETIARTELATASQQAAEDRYRSAGVEKVDVLDGADCGLTSHDDGEKPNGKRYPIGTVPMISHPNCQRVFLPVVER